MNTSCHLVPYPDIAPTLSFACFDQFTLLLCYVSIDSSLQCPFLTDDKTLFDSSISHRIQGNKPTRSYGPKEQQTAVDPVPCWVPRLCFVGSVDPHAEDLTRSSKRNIQCQSQTLCGSATQIGREPAQQNWDSRESAARGDYETCLMGIEVRTV